VVSVDGMGTASVEAVKALPVPGKQKPPCRVGKRLQDRFVAAPEKKKVKKPAGLKTRPAWLRQDCLGANLVVCRRVACCQAWRCCRAGLKAADGNHLVPRPDSDDGVGAAAQNRIEAIVERLKGWSDAALTDPD
jgi:hypothetical protein